MDEAETGLKSALAVKVFGADLDTLQKKGKAIKQILERVRGIRDVTLVQELGQPSLTININRARIARYGLNVADINALIQTAIGGDVATQVVQEEKQFDLVVRLEQPVSRQPGGNRQYPGGHPGRTADSAQGIRRHPGDERRLVHLPPGQFALHRGPVLGGRPRSGRRGGTMPCSRSTQRLPCRRAIGWIGAANIPNIRLRAQQLSVILPLTLFLIFLLLFALYSNFKFPFITVLGVVLSAPVGGIVALWLTGTPFSVSSGIGFLALFGVSVQTAIVYISYVNELRAQGTPIWPPPFAKARSCGCVPS